jgi:hypothetical protein
VPPHRSPDSPRRTTTSEPRASVGGLRRCVFPKRYARLMDLLGTSINAAVVAVVGALLAWLASGRFDAVERRIDRLETRLVGPETRLDGRIDGMESRLHGRIGAMEARLGGRIDGLDGRIGGVELLPRWHGDTPRWPGDAPRWTDRPAGSKGRRAIRRPPVLDGRDAFGSHAGCPRSRRSSSGSERLILPRRHQPVLSGLPISKTYRPPTGIFTRRVIVEAVDEGFD